MKRQTKTLVIKFQQTGSFLLVMLFLFIPFAQAFHHHHSVVKREQSGNDEQLSITVDKCKLCEYYVRKQGKDLDLSYPSVLVVSIPEPIALSTTVIAGIYKFTLQGFTNKGPPLFVA